MSVVRLRWPAPAVGAVALTILNACAVTGVGGSVGVGYDSGYGYGAGYYEPWGYDYGGWGYGYRVGPGRGGDRRRDSDGDRRGEHPSRSYRPAPAERRTPSIPSRARGPHH